MRNAVTDLVSGGLKRWGNCDFSTDGAFDGATEAQVALDEGTVPVPGIETRYNKVVSGAFVEMSAGEKTVADAELGPVILEASAPGVQSNATTTLANALSKSLAANKVPPGKYEATFYCEIACQSLVASSGCMAHLYYQGVEVRSSANDKTQYVAFSGSAIIDVLVDTAVLVEVKFARVGAANTALIRRVTLSLVLQD